MSKMIMRRVHNTCVNMVRMDGSIFGGDIWVALIFAEHCFEVIQKGTKISRTMEFLEWVWECALFVFTSSASWGK